MFVGMKSRCGSNTCSSIFLESKATSNGSGSGGSSSHGSGSESGSKSGNGSGFGHGGSGSGSGSSFGSGSGSAYDSGGSYFYSGSGFGSVYNNTSGSGFRTGAMVNGTLSAVAGTPLVLPSLSWHDYGGGFKMPFSPMPMLEGVYEYTSVHLISEALPGSVGVINTKYNVIDGGLLLFYIYIYNVVQYVHCAKCLYRSVTFASEFLPGEVPCTFTASNQNNQMPLLLSRLSTMREREPETERQGEARRERGGYRERAGERKKERERGREGKRGRGRDGKGNREREKTALALL
jgi:hypothetical protein